MSLPWKHRQVGWIINVPVHLGPRVGEVVRRAQLRVESITPYGGAFDRLDARAHSPEEALKLVQASEFDFSLWDSFCMPYQREAVIQTVRYSGGHLWHSAGSGKTLSATAWLTATHWNPSNWEGIAVVVTKGSVRRNFGREIRRFTSLYPYVAEPADRDRDDWRSPEEYMIRCWERESRPVFVVGWEELATLIYGDEAHAVSREGREVAPKAAGYESPAETLCRVKGVGLTAATAILEGRTLEALKAAAAEDGEAAAEALRAVPGIGPKTAEAIVQALTAPALPETAKERKKGATQAVSGFLAGIAKTYGITSVVFDEIHMAKNPKRKKWRTDEAGQLKGTSLNNLTAAAAKLSGWAKRRLGMTATPLANTPEDFWAQLDLVDPGAWGKGATPYKKWYLDAAAGEYGGLVCQPKMARRKHEEFQFRLGEASWGGREPQWKTVHKVTAAEARKHLPGLRRNVIYLSRGELSAAKKVALDGVRKAIDAPTRHEAQRALAANRKRGATTRHATDGLEAGQKVVAFTARIYDVEALFAAVYHALDRRGIPWMHGTAWEAEVEANGGEAPREGNDPDWKIPIWGLHGGHSTKVRDAACETYLKHTPGPAFIVGTGYALGTGQNLQDTDLALMVMLPDTPKDIEQWEGRFPRLGQCRPVEIRFLIAEGTVDETVAHRLIRKLPAVAEEVGVGDVLTMADDLKGLGDRDAVMAQLLDQRHATYTQMRKEEEAGWWD